VTSAPALPERIRLVVLFGGRSAEHDISCTTARHVVAALDRGRYAIEPVGIRRDGTWVRAAAATRALEAPADASLALPAALDAEGDALDPLPALAGDARSPVVVLPLLHGPFGEDGTVQGLLELADVPFVGSGVLGSALAMDKAAAKDMLAAHGIAQAPWRAAHAPSWSAAEADDVVAALGLPLFVKPANMGSSIGVSKVHDAAALDAAVARAGAYDETVVIEESIEGAREIEVAVLGNLAPRASVPGEIRPAAEFYDFADKYEDGAADLLIPAPLDATTSEQVRSLALDAFRALRAEGLARVDFLFEERGRGPLLNEINTMPGFTPISMYPKLWEASGLPYGALLDELVALALERHARRARHRSTTA
jgi:D-alanine-D-alanine ligase